MYNAETLSVCPCICQSVCSCMSFPCHALGVKQSTPTKLDLLKMKVASLKFIFTN